MSKLTEAQIRSVAALEKFSGKDLDIAVAVALAESGGRTDAHYVGPRDDSYGLWQINMLGGMGPERRQKFHLGSNSDLFKPSTNARVAYAIFKGSGWSAWATYTSGAYKDHLTPGVAAKVVSGSEAVVEDVKDANPIAGVAAAINGFSKSAFNAMANFGGIVIAISLVVVGLVILGRQPIASTAKTVVGIAGPGKIAKVAKVAGKVAS